MFVALPLTCFFLLVLVSLRSGASLRSAAVCAATISYSLLVAMTGILCGFHALSLVPVVAAWAVADLALLVALAVALKGPRLPSVAVVNPVFRPAEWVLLFMVLFILLVELVIALTAPPNTWDSMTYHMSRVMHWIQNRSVEFYPTSIPRQNHLAPGAEYGILHLQLLSGGDYLANLVQWSCGAVGVVVVSLIAAELGGSFFIQLLAALIATALPGAILQSTGTQNDLAVSLWILGSAYYLIRLVRNASPGNALLAGLSIGLALLTKATAYLLVFPLAVVFLLAVIRSPVTRPWHAFRVFFIIGFACLALNGLFYAWNLRLCGNPLGPQNWGSPRTSSFNSRMTPAIFLSNAVRNMALHAATPVPSLNAASYRLIKKALGPNLDDPASTWEGTGFFRPFFSTHEDFAANVLHLVVWIVLLVPLLVWSARANRLALAYIAATLAGAALFPLALRWQPWAGRLHLPLFLMSAAVLGLGIGEWLSRRTALVLAVVFFLCSFPWLFYNQTRPVFGPDSVFTTDRLASSFATRKDCRMPYLAAAGWIGEHRVSTLGLRLGADDWEYPLWSLIKAQQGRLPRIVHVQVQDVSEVLRRNYPAPDAIVTTLWTESLVLNGVAYRRAFTKKPLIILEKVP